MKYGVNSWLIIVFSLILCFDAQGQSSKDSIGLKEEPILYKPGSVSLNDRAEFGFVTNRQGDISYFGVDINGRAEIHCVEWIEKDSFETKVLLTDSIYSFNDPFLSNEEDRLYFISNMPSYEGDTTLDHDIWFVEAFEDNWSSPINAGLNINSDGEEYYISFSRDGSMYFASNKDADPGRSRDLDIYKSSLVNGVFEMPERLPSSVNTGYYEADVFVDPDESFLIFCSIRRSGLGRGDLYVSFRDDAGQWMEAKNLGAPINSEHHELCPFVSHDGQYLYYTSKQDIYWVDIEEVLKIKD